MKKKFLCPSKKSLINMIFEFGREDHFFDPSSSVMKKTVLKTASKKESGYLLPAFQLSNNFAKDVENNFHYNVFIPEMFYRCFRDFLSDDKVSSIIIEAEKLEGKVYPQDAKYRFSTILKVVT